MQDYIKGLSEFIFQVDNLWLFFLAFTAFLFINSLILMARLRYSEKVVQTLERKIDEILNFDATLKKTSELVLSNQPSENIQQFDKDFEKNLPILDRELDNLWRNRRKYAFYKKGFSEKSYDILIQNIIRGIYFKYWGIDDFLKTISSKENEKEIISNNLKGYINDRLVVFLEKLKIENSEVGFNYHNTHPFFRKIQNIYIDIRQIILFEIKS